MGVNRFQVRKNVAEILFPKYGKKNCLHCRELCYLMFLDGKRKNR